MKDEIVYQYEKGYFNSGDNVRREDGCLVAPSANVIYGRDGKLVSLKNLSSYLAHGGSKAMVLDDDLLGFLGTNNTSAKARGNIIQSAGKSLFFVGNSVSNGVKINNPSTDTETVIGSLSSIPQLALYNGSGYSSPVQVGLAEQETAPELILTSPTTRGASFTGIIKGSVSCRLARKRDGIISIASPASNVVTGDLSSMYVTIPAILADGSDEWVLYFTYTGKGSQFTHLMFPLFIPENQLDGSNSPTLFTQGNAKLKVVSAHASTQANRKVEVEFYNNDLLLLSPFEDYFAADACKFLFQLGNCMCLVGTGDYNTGFDVSKPANFEAYAPEDRDWFDEEPIAICQSAEMGFYWILGRHTVYQAIWSGAKNSTAPVVLKQKSSIYGAIGESSCISINGVLYFLSVGKTPIRMGTSGELDKDFGYHVHRVFSSYDSTTVLSHDEATNSIVFICGMNSIAFQIDTEIWGAPCTHTSTGITAIDSAISYNGNLYVCGYDGASYKTKKYNGSGNLSWNATSNFRTGKFGLALKDLIEGRLVMESESQPYTVSITAYKDYDTSSGEVLYGVSNTVTGTKIALQYYLESYDYETISIKISGTLGAQTVHLFSLMVDAHTIERRS
jgi:hypothetical protein